MGSRLARVRAAVRRALGPTDPGEDDVLRVLESESCAMLPLLQPARRRTAIEASRALSSGWRRGTGRRGLRQARRKLIEFGELAPSPIAPGLRRLFSALQREIDNGGGDRFD